MYKNFITLLTISALLLFFMAMSWCFLQENRALKNEIIELYQKRKNDLLMFKQTQNLYDTLLYKKDSLIHKLINE
ncbi:MAG: hypothetical protein ACRCR9_00140 [Chitinophagaceae bacterium]